MICIYQITSPSNRIYIGQTVDWNRRLKEYHKSLAKTQTKLHRSIKKYGIESHKFEVIHECTYDKLNELEVYYIDLFDTVNKGLNAKGGGANGYMPENVRKRISKAHKGKVVKESTKDKLRSYIGSKHHGYGKTHKPETIDKMRAKAKDRRHTEETKRKLSAIQMGGNSPLAKKVLDLNTGIFYDSPRDVANTFGINLVTLRCWLNGSLKNKTQFIYC